MGLLTMYSDDSLDLTRLEWDGSFSSIMTSEVCKIHMLHNYERHLLDMGNFSNFGELIHTSIARSTWIRFVKHPKQKGLVDFCDKKNMQTLERFKVICRLVSYDEVV